MINIFESYADAGQQLSQREKEQYYSALIEFIAYGKEPNLKGAAAAVFTAIRPSLELSKKRSENGKKGGRKSQANDEFASKQNESKTEANGVANGELASPIYIPTTNTTNTTGVGGVGGGESKPRFSKPTESEVSEYASSKGHPDFDAGKFCDFYESKGWKVGKNPMKDWKAAVRNWMRDSDSPPKTRRGVQADERFAKYR